MIIAKYLTGNRLHCYVVVKVKITSYAPSYPGNAVAINHVLKSQMDAPTLGLLFCISKDNDETKYAMDRSSFKGSKERKVIILKKK